LIRCPKHSWLLRLKETRRESLPNFSTQIARQCTTMLPFEAFKSLMKSSSSTVTLLGQLGRQASLLSPQHKQKRLQSTQ
jgi:hypothetical protein